MVVLDSLSPDMVDVITDAIEERLFELHTGLPAIVDAFSASNQMVDVTPLLKRVFLDANQEEFTIDMPKINNVPILYPAGGGWSITWPMQKGDIVYLAFAERSLDNWHEAQPGQLIDPVQTRKHDLNDAVCVPALRPRVNPLSNISATDLTLGREDSSNQIVIKADGTIELGATPTESAVLGDELVTYLTTLIGVFNAHIHLDSLGAPTAPTLTPQSAPTTILSTVVKVK